MPRYSSCPEEAAPINESIGSVEGSSADQERRHKQPHAAINGSRARRKRGRPEPMLAWVREKEPPMESSLGGRGAGK
eukprot:2124431-Rhodomonas_salina.1